MKPIERAIRSLTKERDKLNAAIGSLTELLDAMPPRRIPRRNAERGMLQKMMIEALQSGPLRPHALRDAVVQLGYPVRNKNNLYIAVYNKAKSTDVFTVFKRRDTTYFKLAWSPVSRNHC